MLPIIALVASLFIICSNIASAQGNARPVAIEFDGGLGGGFGGGRLHERFMVSTSALVTWRSSPNGTAFIAGVGAGLNSVPDTECVIALSGGDCIADFPGFAEVGLSAGVELNVRGPDLRLLAGPAVFRNGSNDKTFGIQGRFDVATSRTAHVAFVLSAQGALLPDFHDRMLTMAALGIGFRFRPGN